MNKSCELKFSIIDTKKVTTLVELLYKYAKELPVELLEQLKLCGNSEVFEYGHKEIDSMIRMVEDKKINYDFFSVVCDGKIIDHVKSVNKVLKRVIVTNFADGFPEVKNNGFVINEIYPKKMSIIYKNNTLVSW